MERRLTPLSVVTGLAVFVLAMSFASPAWAQSHGPAQVRAGEEHCVVNVGSFDRLNVRRGASASADVVTTHHYGDCGIVVTGECKDGWCPVDDGHVEGWVNEKLIAMVAPPFYCVSGVADGDVLRLRAYPSEISRVVAELASHECDIAALPYAFQGWLKVRANGFEGWVELQSLYAQ